MSVGKQGPAVAVIFYDDSPGGTARNVGTGIRTIGALAVTQMTEKNTPFNLAYDTNTPVGVQSFPDVEIGGDFDTTPTTGTHAVFGTPDSDPNGATRTLTVQPAGTGSGLPQLQVETILADYQLILTNGKLTGYKAKVQQKGLAAWSTQ